MPMDLETFLREHGIAAARHEHPPVMTVEESERLAKHLAITPGSVSLLALVNDHAHAVEFVIDRALWQAPAVHAHPLTNEATMVIAHEDLERFLAATGHAPRVIDVPAARTIDSP